MIPDTCTLGLGIKWGWTYHFLRNSHIINILSSLTSSSFFDRFPLSFWFYFLDLAHSFIQLDFPRLVFVMSEPDLALVAVTLTGSLLSLFGTSFILLCYMILPHKRHIRHALIVNLTFAGESRFPVGNLGIWEFESWWCATDFMNAMNNSISGLWVVWTDSNLQVSDGCTANGFVGQLSVQVWPFFSADIAPIWQIAQAVDFSILTITIVTLWIILGRRVTNDFSLSRILQFCVASWIIPIITSTLQFHS